MSTQDAMGMAGKVIERWGFPTLVALCLMYFVRVDLVIPMVDAHGKFLDEIGRAHV